MCIFCVALAYNNFTSHAKCGRKIIFDEWLGGLKINYKFKFFNKKLSVFRENRKTVCVCVCVTFLQYILKGTHSSQENKAEIHIF